MTTQERQTAYTPLPTYWPVRGKHYGERITTLPPHYVRWALHSLTMTPPLRAAVYAVNGFYQLALDQREGR